MLFSREIRILLGLIVLGAVLFGAYVYVLPHLGFNTDVSDPVRSAYNANEFNAAIASAERLLAQNPYDTETLLMLATAWAQRGVIEYNALEYAPQAIEVAQRVLIREPENAEAHRIIGYAYETQGLYDLAQETYETAFALAKNTGLLHLDMGRLLEKIGNHEEAYAHYLEAAAAGVDPGRTYVNLGRMQIADGNLLEAKESLARAFARADNVRVKAEAAYLLGTTHLLEEGYDDALEFMHQSVETDATFALAYIGRAHVSIGMLATLSGEAERTATIQSALNDIERALILNGNQTAAYVLLARILDGIGTEEDAANVYRRAQEVLVHDTTLTASTRSELEKLISEELEDAPLAEPITRTEPTGLFGVSPRALIAGGGGGGGGCFISDTDVTLADGTTKAIQDITIGDRVIGQDGSINTVTDTYQPLLGDRPLYSINNTEAFVTGGHPFLDTDGHWRAIDTEEAKRDNPTLTVLPLTVGDTIVTTDGTLTVTSITATAADPETQLYNFRTDNTNTFIADGFVVHNKDGGGGGGGGVGGGVGVINFVGINFDICNGVPNCGITLPPVTPPASGGSTVAGSCSVPTTPPPAPVVEMPPPQNYTVAERTFKPGQRSALAFGFLGGNKIVGCNPKTSTSQAGRPGGIRRTTTFSPCYPDNATADFICKGHGWEWGVQSIKTSDSLVEAAYAFTGTRWKMYGEESSSLPIGRFGQNRNLTPAPKETPQIQSVTCNAPPQGSFFIAGNACAGGQCHWGNNPATPILKQHNDDAATYFCRLKGYETFVSYESRPKASAVQGHVLAKVSPYPPITQMTPAQIMAAAQSEVRVWLGDTSCTSNCWYRLGFVSCKLPTVAPTPPPVVNNPPASCEVPEAGGGEEGVEDTAMTITVNKAQDACYLNEQYVLRLRGTDPQRDKVRYAIDWDADGFVDEYVPAQGYVDSGVEREAGYVFTEEVDMTVQVRTEDQSGNFSEWSETITFSCADNRAPGVPQVSSGQCIPDEPHTFSIETVHPAGKSVYYEIDTNQNGVSNQRIPASGTVAPGVVQTVQYTFPQGLYAFNVRAVDTDSIASSWRIVGGMCGVDASVCPSCTVGTPEITLHAQPSLVTPGQTTQLSWSISGLNTIEACSISGTNGHTVSWETISSTLGQTTLPITGQTTYTLTCGFAGLGNLTKQVTIFLTPAWQEF